MCHFPPILLTKHCKGIYSSFNLGKSLCALKIITCYPLLSSLLLPPPPHFQSALPLSNTVIISITVTHRLCVSIQKGSKTKVGGQTKEATLMESTELDKMIIDPSIQLIRCKEKYNAVNDISTECTQRMYRTCRNTDNIGIEITTQ